MTDPSDAIQSDHSELPSKWKRYERQIRYPAFGLTGQERLAASRVLVVGAGALGSVIANTLVRAGVGTLRLVDRDFLELNNLQRQVLYDERDVEEGMPKAIAAAAKLRRINSDVTIEPLVADVDSNNIESLCESVDLILDGTDNFEIRFLINDASIKLEIPWIYGGCLGCDGQSMTILPKETACLRCLMMDGPPPPGTTPTCDSAGILAPIINVIASVQVSEALKILSGNRDAVSRSLAVFDLWSNHMRHMNLATLRESVKCPCCLDHDFEWLDGRRGSHTAILCGRNAVQLSFPERDAIDLDALYRRLESVGEIQRNPFLLRLHVDGFSVTVFQDGRAIVMGTEDIAKAKSLYARYVGV